jgi:peroxiredoxin
MMVMRIVLAVLCLVAELCAAGPNAAGELMFKDLDGREHHPLDPGEKAGSVLFFYWHDCPICNGYAPEINRICASRTNFTFYIVQVDPDLTPEAAKKHARDYDLRAPVLLDPQHRLVGLAKATVTPEAVVVGRDGQVRYRGRIDDLYPALGKRRAAATQHDLCAALDAVTAGKPVKKKETKALGCLIELQKR